MDVFTASNTGTQNKIHFIFKRMPLVEVVRVLGNTCSSAFDVTDGLFILPVNLKSTPVIKIIDMVNIIIYEKLYSVFIPVIP